MFRLLPKKGSLATGPGSSSGEFHAETQRRGEAEEGKRGSHAKTQRRKAKTAKKIPETAFLPTAYSLQPSQLLLHPFQLSIAAVVTVFLDQLSGLGEGFAGLVQVALGVVETGLFPLDVGLKEGHRTAGGDLGGLVEVLLGTLGEGLVSAVLELDAVELGAGDEGAWLMVSSACLAQAGDGAVQVVLGRGEWVRGGGVQDRLQQEGAAQGEVVEGSRKNIFLPAFNPFQRLSGPLPDLAAAGEGVLAGEGWRRLGDPGRGLALSQQKVAVLEAPQRVEQRELGVILLLHSLGLLKEGAGLPEVSGLVEGVGQGCAVDHPLFGVSAAVGQFHAVPGIVHGLEEVSQGQVEFAQVAGLYGSIFPIFA